MKKSVLGLVLLGIASSVAMNVAITKDNFANYAPLSLLEQRAHVLQSLRVAYYQLGNKYQDKKGVKKLIKVAEKEYKLFAIEECDSESCPLQRKNNPHFRSQFAERVSKALVEQLKRSSEKKVVFVPFGCGGLFPELCCLTSALNQEPAAQIEIHGIDTMYKDYITKSRTNKAAFHCVSSQEKVVRKDFISLIALRFNQFMQWFDQYPHARISFYIHSSVTDYFAYRKKENKSYPDVISAIDIEDASAVKAQSLQNYYDLCSKSLKKKPTLSNIWLGFFGDYTTPLIANYFLDGNQQLQIKKEALVTEKKSSLSDKKSKKRKREDS